MRYHGPPLKMTIYGGRGPAVPLAEFWDWKQEGERSSYWIDHTSVVHGAAKQAGVV